VGPQGERAGVPVLLCRLHQGPENIKAEILGSNFKGASQESNTVRSIDAMQAEIEYQTRDLSKLKLPPASKNCILIGSGDSFAAALAAQYLSDSHALCCHPADVISNPSIVDGRDAYIVSISGNTKANILAARAAKERGVNTIAITARPASRLADACDRVIELKYRNAGTATAGTISFTSSLLVCALLATKIRLPPSIDKIYQQAEKQANRIAARIGNKGRYLILGDSLLYPVALYGALKFNEVFGARAVPYPAEEFCHSPIFSARKSDQIIVIGAEKDSKKLNNRLSQEGFSSVHVNFDGTGIELLLQSIFFTQLLVLKLARKRGLDDCYFLKNKKLLKMSSDFIFG
jgi:fructoselysine-6-P-deglycase FrlB-like protein